MDSQRLLLVCLFFILYLAACLICPSDAYGFIVGGKDGWTLNPSENYNQWAGRMRFLVNDTLSFKYPKGSDSVLVVNKDDYDKCNTSKPILKLDDGDSVFKFDRSGPFYFITGNKSNCDQGQKLHIVVLTIRNINNPPSLAPFPSPTANNPPPPTPAAVSPPPATAPADNNSPPPPLTSFAPAVSRPSLVLLSLAVGVALGSFITTTLLPISE